MEVPAEIVAGLLGAQTILVGALVAMIRKQRASGDANGYFRPENEYPTTVKQLEAFIEESVFHRRNGDLMHWRTVLERYAEGKHVEAMEAFERLVDIHPRGRR